MLPAFAAWVLGGDDTAANAPMWVRLWRAVRLGVVVTVAFVAVFAVAGAAVGVGARLLAGISQWVSLLVGVVLVAYGVLVIAGRASGGLRLPNPAHERAGGSALLSGAGYAVVSLSCTLPVFLSVAGVSLTAGGGMAGLGAFAAYAAYALGMGTVVTAVALTVAAARERLVGRLRGASRAVTRFSGGLLAAVGVYVTGYAAYTLWAGLADGGAPAPIAWVTRMSSDASQLVASSTGRVVVAAAGVAVLTVVAMAVLRRLGWRPPGEGSSTRPPSAQVSVGDGAADDDQRCC